MDKKELQDKTDDKIQEEPQNELQINFPIELKELNINNNSSLWILMLLILIVKH